MTVRRATADDAEQLAAIQVRTWLAAYADYVDPQLMHEAAEGRAERWAERLAAGAEVLVAQAGGKVAGFAGYGPARDEESDERTGELYAIYVAPEAQGAGVGTELHAASMQELRAAGFTQATLWVFVGNERARSFYETLGWQPEHGSERADPWAPQLRYRRAL